MARRRYSPEEIKGRLREAEVALAEGVCLIWVRNTHSANASNVRIGPQCCRSNGAQHSVVWARSRPSLHLAPRSEERDKPAVGVKF